ncbi:hypothetical protein UCYN_07180 [Candidatus Atelocyanobacterium thalassa isolate ALOHA]|uniref:Uncharacterized protein n=1 Tax=Atelocyanobacterium thalassa (isolate ALOHA) TaxID=1453429 RepID=D3EPL4_ATETH|nr:hypothetical protein UCYN_07180 [Candidatus Atelocyanobacterium thalassa isolate ALOHA]
MEEEIIIASLDNENIHTNLNLAIKSHKFFL